jgi:hypothetical protein
MQQLSLFFDGDKLVAGKLDVVAGIFSQQQADLFKLLL